MLKDVPFGSAESIEDERLRTSHHKILSALMSTSPLGTQLAGGEVDSIVAFLKTLTARFRRCVTPSCHRARTAYPIPPR